MAVWRAPDNPLIRPEDVPDNWNAFVQGLRSTAAGPQAAPRGGPRGLLPGKSLAFHLSATVSFGSQRAMSELFGLMDIFTFGWHD